MSHPVKLYIYDLTKGLAKTMSSALLGKQIDGIWHTGIVVFGREYFYGSQGIESFRPGNTILGQPDQIFDLGETEIPFELYLEYIGGLSARSYRGNHYNLFEHNCNTFSAELAEFLTGNHIPTYITELPREIMDTPIGQSIKPLIDSLSQRSYDKVFRGDASNGMSDEDAAAIAAAMAGTDDYEGAVGGMGSPPAPVRSNVPKEESDPAKSENGENAGSEDDSTEADEPRGTPVLFYDVDISTSYAALKSSLEGKWDPAELESLDEIYEFLSSCNEAELTWNISRSHLMFMGSLLESPDLSSEIKIKVLELLQACTLQVNTVNLLKYIRANPIMRYAYYIDTLSNEEKEVILKMFSNGCHCKSGFDWLLSFFDWELENQTISNGKILSNLCVHCLSSGNIRLIGLATALVHNVSLSEVAEEVALDLVAATLHIMKGSLTESIVLNSLNAIYNFMEISTDVVPMIKTFAVDMNRFKEKYPTSAEVLIKIQVRLDRERR